MPPGSPIRLATRGSALALAQANQVLAQCREAFPQVAFEIRIIKTTGDKLQTASMAQPDASLPKGLFTKELEVALLEGTADLAVHSLKDLPTDLPAGLVLGAVGVRADVRDVLISRAPDAAAAVPSSPGLAQSPLTALPSNATVATSSTRRKAQLLALRPDLAVVEIRGNVATRLRKLATQSTLAATLLAAAGLARLHYRITAEGRLLGEDVPDGLVATPLAPELMLPCVGQAAVGLEIRAGDDRLEAICRKLNHPETLECVTAERAFLQAMGGGCQSPVAAFAEVTGDQLRLRAISFRDGPARRAELRGPRSDPSDLGRRAATQLSIF